mgnify:CR=1 FL=1
MRQQIQQFGRTLSGMVMPNIGAFIAWGFITALFIPEGWWPNGQLAQLVGPMLTYLLPLLIAYPTADYGVTLPLGVLTFLLIHYNQFKYQKPKEIWEGMCSPLPPWLPIWLPINLISEIAVPISLSLRLFANVLSGTVMMALIYGLLGVIATAWPAALHVYFDLFSGAIQTYVFCMLTMTYIANARGDA